VVLIKPRGSLSSVKFRQIIHILDDINVALVDFAFGFGAATVLK